MIHLTEPDAHFGDDGPNGPVEHELQIGLQFGLESVQFGLQLVFGFRSQPLHIFLTNRVSPEYAVQLLRNRHTPRNDSISSTNARKQSANRPT